jgi:hypothetical protein
MIIRQGAAMSTKFKFPDTGQDTSYDQNGRAIIANPGDVLYGQDGCYTVHPMAFDKLDGDGTPLSDSAVWEDGLRMVFDRNTGLTWEVKSPEPGDVNYCDDCYSWEDAQKTYVNKLNQHHYGGFDDWRIPNKDELRSIIHYDRTNPALDVSCFPHSQIQLYWCSVTYEMQPYFAWVLFLGLGSATAVSKDSERHVMAVRGGYNALFGCPDVSRFTDNGDGTISDSVTGLMWQKGENERMDWYDALNACQEMDLGGYQDWRLPNIKELNTILNLTHQDGWWYFRDFFPAEDLQPPLLHYFSSSVFQKTYAWVTNFNFGYDGYYASKNARLLFRAVRHIHPPREIEISRRFRFSDTGQILCYDNEGRQIPKPEKTQAFYGQDGQYAFHPMAFDKLDENRSPLSEDSDWKAGWRTVKDRNTGLIWEVKSADTADFNDHEQRFTWDEARNYIETLNRRKYGGFETWRLPNREELRTIVNYNDQVPAVDTAFFPGIKPDFYWSRDAYTPNPDLKWGIYFAYGCGICYLHDLPFYVLGVCEGYQPAFGDTDRYQFLDNGDGTVSDLNSGLMWKKEESPEMTFVEALAYCEQLALADHHDWRLPTMKEIATLMDLSCQDDAWFHKDFFPDVKTTPLGFYWSSSTFAATFGWGVNFQFGYDGYYADKKNGRYPFRPVRFIQGPS